MTEVVGKRTVLSRGWTWLGGMAAAMWQRVEPEPRTLRAISFATYFSTILFGAYWGYERSLASDLLVLFGHHGPPLLGAQQMWWDLAAGASLTALLVLSASGLFFLALRGARWLPTAIGRVGVGAIPTLFILCAEIGFGLRERLVIAALVLALVGGMCGAVASLTSGKFGAKGWFDKATVWGCLLLAIGGAIALPFGLLHRGSLAHLTEFPEYAGESEPTMLALPDPGKPGPFGKVHSLTYGSGSDMHRPEFGAEATIKTATVNGRPFAQLPTGHKGKKRELFWQFSLGEMPINGRVWYPEGDGPFPLVLIAHGNHAMREFSDEGYEYLGRHLASHGYIFCSVDQNFLNGINGRNIHGESDARGWLLLEHLKVWRGFQHAAGNPLAGKVDMQNIALMGHSRGGEAVTHAVLFNRLKHYPDDASVTFDFGFAIKSIVSIAPVDGQYQPAGRLAPVSDVNYLTLHGSHDADVTNFEGDRIYDRVSFAPGSDHFKSSVYVYRANHGQYNTVWGATDYGPPRSLLLNRAVLLDGEDQRQIGKAYITAFLEASIRANRGYRRLFVLPRSGRDWLPDARLVTRYEDASFRVLADFEEDVDVTTTSAPDGVIRADGFVVYREADVSHRSGQARSNQAVFLGWKTGSEEVVSGKEDAAAVAVSAPTYEISLPKGFLAASASVPQQLVFHMAEADEEPEAQNYAPSSDDEIGSDGEVDAVANAPDNQAGSDDGSPRPALQLAVELVTPDGVVRLPLSRYGTLVPPLKAVQWRVPRLSGHRGLTEITLQVFGLPLSDFVALDPKLDLAAVTAIRFVFDRKQQGVVVMDRIGIANVLE